MGSAGVWLVLRRELFAGLVGGETAVFTLLLLLLPALFLMLIIVTAWVTVFGPHQPPDFRDAVITALRGFFGVDAASIAEREAVQRGRRVNRVSGDADQQLRERHAASDFDRTPSGKPEGA